MDNEKRIAKGIDAQSSSDLTSTSNGGNGHTTTPTPEAKLRRRRGVQHYNAVQAAVQQAGGVVVVTARLDVSRRVVHWWMKRGHMRGVAAENVLLLAKLSGISAEVLCGL